MLLPLQGESAICLHHPGRRFALPWATCRLPFQGVLNSLISQQKNHLSSYDFFHHELFECGPNFTTLNAFKQFG